MKKTLSILSLVAVSAFIGGCSTHPADPKISMNPPEYVEEIPPAMEDEPFSNPGSLYGKGSSPLFSDPIAMKVNDIVTVIIEETASQSTSAQKALSEESSNKLGGGVTTYGGDNTKLKDLVSTINGYSSIGFEAGSKNGFTGKGTNSRDDKFTTTISARIVKVLNNGNYFIEGRRELLINGEKQIVQITGVIRPYDIDIKNSISSKYIADAKILYNTQGDIKETTRQPWGNKFMQSIWPF